MTIKAIYRHSLIAALAAMVMACTAAAGPSVARVYPERAGPRVPPRSQTTFLWARGPRRSPRKTFVRPA